jgi:hypothetical protein
MKKIFKGIIWGAILSIIGFVVIVVIMGLIKLILPMSWDLIFWIAGCGAGCGLACGIVIGIND